MRIPLGYRTFSSISPKYSLPLTVKQLLASAGTPNEPTTVTGYVKSVRRQKNVSFAVITDGSTSRGLQAVFPGSASSEFTKGLYTGTAIRLTGELKDSPGQGQAKELVVAAEGITILGGGGEDYPLQKKSHSPEFLRDWVHLRARTDAGAAILRLRQDLQTSISSFFSEHQFTHIHTPVLTGNDAEGAGETFKLAPVPLRNSQEGSDSFFSPSANLTVSAQLHLEVMTQALGRTWVLGPCFRAERSASRRHLSEFWMLEAEWVLSQGVHEVMSFIEAFTRTVVASILSSSSDNLTTLTPSASHLDSITTSIQSAEPWVRMSYTDAIRALQLSGQAFEYRPEWGQALQTEHEKWLCEEHVKGPLFVHDYPRKCKSFYMRVNPQLDETGHETVACFDLLVPGVGELAGGSVREERIAHLKEVIEEGSALEWYLDLRKFGGLPTGGFGIGFERLISWLTGIENVRDCIPVPRTVGKLML